MAAPRALKLTNEVVNVPQFVVLAAKVVGPGPLRLELVKLPHELSDDRGTCTAALPSRWRG